MRRPASLGLLALSLALLAFPLALEKPGWPGGLKADEPAYYLMARSLALDGDLRFEAEDATRLFQEFPYSPARNLIVMTDDGWRTVFYGKPYLYSLVAAPLAGPFGANGLIFLNMLLTVAMIWMGYRYLADRDDEVPAALFSAGFFLLSAGFAYVFWIQPEVFNMACVAAACYLAFLEPVRRRIPSWARAGLAGGALALAVYNKPMLAAVAIGPLAVYGRRRWREAAAFLAGGAVALGLAAGVATVLTGHPSAYLGVTRQGVTVCEPGVVPIGPGPEGGAAPEQDRPTGGAWSWIFRIPTYGFATLPESLLYFFVGRHTGLLPYFPFAVASLLCFVLARRRSPERWWLLAGLAVVALFFLLFIPRNWQGGGGFVGNRYFVNAIPAFLFLVPRVRPRWLLPAVYAVGGLFLFPMLLTPFSRVGAEPTLQGHVRNAPFPLLPMEHTLREIPGSVDAESGPFQIQGRRDVFLPRGGGSFWIRGATKAELWIRGPVPLERPRWLVESPVDGNRIRIAIEGVDAERTLDAGEGAALELPVADDDGEAPFLYRMTVEADRGALTSWTRHLPPPVCPTFGGQESWEETFYLGARVVLLGEAESLDADVYDAELRAGTPPRTIPAGSEIGLPVEIANRSPEIWRATGAARVRLGYRWVRGGEGGESEEGGRAELPLPMDPGESARVRLDIEAPEDPGPYLLEIEPLVEHVAWFGGRDPDATLRFPIRVTRSGAGRGSAPAGGTPTP